ncbi:hypothetical protein CEXT_414971 [Caerostris extrusa]|uniref:Uncharacterized protein n=1 Tax=Caerostris extrusa TaxID=172846 RepID=A0AAV4N170_CAEEX|nr:hypothetical protein CEXT_414971 [Caerostris extrusa]
MPNKGTNGFQQRKGESPFRFVASRGWNLWCVIIERSDFEFNEQKLEGGMNYWKIRFGGKDDVRKISIQQMSVGSQSILTVALSNVEPLSIHTNMFDPNPSQGMPRPTEPAALHLAVIELEPSPANRAKCCRSPTLEGLIA